MIEPTLTASTNNSPPTISRIVFFVENRRHPAIAPSSRVAPSATKPISNRK